MKNIFLFVVLAIFATSLSAQKITTKETSGKFNKETHNSIITYVYHSNVKSVEKELKSLLKEYKGKISSKKGVIFGDNLLITSISNNTIDAFATVEEGADGEVAVTVAFDLGGAFLASSSHVAEFDRASQIIREFALGITEKAYAEFLEDEEKLLDRAQKEYDKTVDNKDGLIKDNEEMARQIEENEAEVEGLTKTIEEKGTALKEQQKAFEDLKNEASKIK